jgi:mannosylglycerate hydrolase
LIDFHNCVILSIIIDTLLVLLSMEKSMTAHIISHTHWDREWFLSSPFTREWLVGFFDSLFSLLEREAGYRFILDGQTLMIEDYFEALKSQGKNPLEYREKLKKYALERRLTAGPYYLQPDWQLVSEESLVRNLIVGRKMAQSLGACMEVGWLVDNFGQISQAVQIHKGFGFKGLFVWRGVEMDPGKVSLEFIWKSPDGSSLTAVYLLDSYRNAMRLGEYPEIFEQRVIHEVQKLKPFATTSHILLMNGYDQEIQPDDILPLIRRVQRDDLTLMQSTPGKYIAAVEKEKPALPVLRGYQYSGSFISVFPGVLSSRMYLKIMNDHCQRLIEKQTEPVSTLLWLLGGEYDRERMTDLWKLLLQNHPHDSICGVAIDEVHTDMEKRMDKTAHLAEGIAKQALASLSELIDTSRGISGRGDKERRGAYIVFNPSLSERDVVITVRPEMRVGLVADGEGEILPLQMTDDGLLHIWLKSLPACGYKTFFTAYSGVDGIPPAAGASSRKNARSSSLNASGVGAISIDEEKGVVENRYLRIRVNEDGSLDAFDKTNQFTYRGLMVFEDGADAGDTYNYSPARSDSLVLSSSQKANIEVIETGPLRATVRISTEIDLPEQLSEDRKMRSSRRRALPIVTWITIEAHSPLLRFRTLIKNTVKDHRLRVLFPTGLKTDKSYAETQFDVVAHAIDPSFVGDSLFPDYLKRVLLGAHESGPITTFAQRSFVDLSDGKRAMAVINRGLPEYEILKEDTKVALTLFRSVGWLARGDLTTRIGDAGPAIFTPEAQCLREMVFHYALYFHGGNWLDGKVHQMADRFNSECVVIKTDRHPGILPDRHGFMKLDSSSEALKVTAVKRSEDGRGVIIRCYNPSTRTVEGALVSELTVASASRADLKETVKERIENRADNRIIFRAKPKEIVTLKVLLQRKNLLINSKVPSQSEFFWPRIFERRADLSAYVSMPVITKEEIAMEERRIEEIKEKLQKLRENSERMDRISEGKREAKKSETTAELQSSRGEVATCERALLEARLSCILSKKKYTELNPAQRDYSMTDEKFVSMCREIGAKLNKARIKKRTFDYLVEFYNSRDSA